MENRRIKTVICVILLLVLFKTTSEAGSSFLNVTMNKEKFRVMEVPILMNGKIIKSESPSFLYVDRTLVPARLIAENYGAKVGWDMPTETAIINHGGNKIELKINSNKAKINGKEHILDNSSTPRLVDFGSGEAKTMVPLTFLADVLGYTTDWDDSQKAAYLVKKDNGGNTEVAENTSNYNKVSSIAVEGNNIIVNGSKKVKYNTLKFTNPNRLVVDLMDSELVGTDYLEKTVSMGNIKGVRASQFVPDQNYKPTDKIVRVVIDIVDNSNPNGAKVVESGNQILISSQYTGDTTKPTIDNNGGEDNNQVVSNSSVVYNNTANTINIKAENSTRFNVNYNKADTTLTVTAPSSDLMLSAGKTDVLNELLIDYDVKMAGNQTQIDFHFRRDVKHNVTSGYNTDNLVIKMDKASLITKDQRIIVIDPGHGGGDPGSSSASGIKEKDIALAVSLKLKDKLENAGYGKVLMTRDNDKTLVLKDRPEFANQNYADVLVSVHANSAGSKSSGVTGIEVLYTPNSKNYAKSTQQTELAKMVLDELIKETKANNRGIKQRPNLVVIRDSKMSSILVELGFLSNPGEANLLNNDAYQERLANAIFRGMEKYLNTYN